MSQIATTIDQSKRLLAAGLDPESADMMWRNVVLTYDFGTAMEVSTAEPILYAFNAKSKDSVPAWSLSKLWDAFGLDIAVGGWFSAASSTSEDVIEELVRLIELRHANH